ncbi:MAG: DUF433 domain-containing protein [Deltaproteobacteria bacterium]|nr:DUF433 domain-containing protein [Deltaproteobacteria bacterium]
MPEFCQRASRTESWQCWPIIRGRQLAVEHVFGMLAAGDTAETILEGYPWLEPEDVQACLVYARRVGGYKRIEPLER